MDGWWFGLIGIVVGAFAGTTGTALLLLNRRARVQTELGNARMQADLLQRQSDETRAELKDTRQRLEETRRDRESAIRESTALTEKLGAREAQFREQMRLLEAAESRLGTTFAAHGARALQANNEQFLKLAQTTFDTLLSKTRGEGDQRQQAIDNLVRPIRELLERHGAAITEIEKRREVAYRGLEEQIKHIAASHERLSTETTRLVTALRRPEQRGRWGEMQLRNVVELAGMSSHCDFREQPQTDDETTEDRPDMIVYLPGGGVIVVDSKVALDAYLDGVQTETNRRPQLQRHAEQVERHYKRLASKRYWEQFERTPKLVVMFMPLESALVAALEIKPTLHADAMQNHVLISTPTLLIALLRAVAYGWQQESITANAREIAKVGRELHERIATFVGHFEDVGGRLRRASESYNKAVGSLQSRILPSARKLEQLDVGTSKEIEDPPPVDIEVRQIPVPEQRPA